jgi:catalase
MSQDKNDDALVQRTINLMENSGYQPGFRRVHARGHGFRGSFTATPEAAALTSAEHMQGDPVDAVIRFSNGSANPYGPDRRSRTRGPGLGLGIRFALPSGGSAEWVGLTLERFPPTVPEDFTGMIAAARRLPVPGNPPNPLALIAFFATHPRCIPGFRAIFTSAPWDSFATPPYHGLHAYWAVNAKGERRAFRYTWEPLQEGAELTEEDDKVLPPQYLISELKGRLERAPVRWKLVFTLAEEDDPVNDMNKVWPDDREKVVMGELVIDRDHEDQDAVDASVFDPTKVPPGIETSDDPVLAFRSTIYSESKKRRAAEGKPAIKPE